MGTFLESLYRACRNYFAPLQREVREKDNVRELSARTEGVLAHGSNNDTGARARVSNITMCFWRSLYKST